MASTAPIPQPKGDLFVGNLRSVDGDAPIQGFMRLARIHGPIYQLDILGNPLVIVSSQALVNELCDETRFDKRVARRARGTSATSPATACSPPTPTSRTGPRRIAC